MYGQEEKKEKKNVGLHFFHKWRQMRMTKFDFLTNLEKGYSIIFIAKIRNLNDVNKF